MREAPRACGCIAGQRRGRRLVGAAGHRRAADQGHGARGGVLGARRARRARRRAGPRPVRGIGRARHRGAVAGRSGDACSSSVIARAAAVIAENLETFALRRATRGSCGRMRARSSPRRRRARRRSTSCSPIRPTARPTTTVAAGRSARSRRRACSRRTPVVVLERPTGAEVSPPPELRATWERTFGDTLVVFLEPSSAP